MKEINRRLNKGLEPYEEGINICLSEKQIDKLVIFCIQHKDELLIRSKRCSEFAEEYKENKERYNVFKSNSEYYKDMYETIKEIKEYIDNYVSLI